MAGDGAVPLVGLVDDHPLVATGLERLLGDIPDLAWAGVGRTVDELVAGYPAVDVAILDLRLEDGSVPFDNVHRLQSIGAKVLVYTSGEHPELLRSAAGAGAMGVVLKSEPEPVIVEAIRSVARGEPVLNTQWAAAVDADPNLGAIDLSPQLQRVLTRYGDGETVPTIAGGLDISEETVKDYLRRIRLKYAEAGRPIKGKQDFGKRAMEDGWLPYPRRRRG
jgi:two-component system, NarL family, nitrate/nitrite response regulator NarL